MNTELADLIRETIRACGPQPFSWFMQQALYHPRHGYYSSGRAAIGRQGDYFTSVSVGPLFGQLLAAQFVEIWERLGKPGRRGDIDNFVIVEQGAHDGQFARDLLESVKKHAPECFAALRYRIVEPFPVWQDRQSKTLEGCAPSRPEDSGTTQRSSLQSFSDKIEWYQSLDGLEPFVGIHFSNELLDAMPIDLPGKLVGLDGDDFVFIEQPEAAVSKPSSPFNQTALDWIDNVAANLRRGYIIAIDYGHARQGFEPTPQIRAQHRHLDSPFEQIGHADITAHVDWSSIAGRAQKSGLTMAGFTDQHHFLTGILSDNPSGSLSARPNPSNDGSLDSTALSSRAPGSDQDNKARRQLQTLLHPEMMGRSFQVLALAKDIEPGAPLAGFKFARTPDL